MATAKCSQCARLLPDDGKQRRTVRPRTCRDCKCVLRAKARKEQSNTPKGMCQRLYKTLRLHHMSKEAIGQFLSPEFVTRVLERWGNACVVTGQTMATLDLIPYRGFVDYAKQPDAVPRERDWVVVSASLKRALGGHHVNPEERMAKFPEQVHTAMLGE